MQVVIELAAVDLILAAVMEKVIMSITMMLIDLREKCNPCNNSSNSNYNNNNRLEMKQQCET